MSLLIYCLAAIGAICCLVFAFILFEELCTEFKKGFRKKHSHKDKHNKKDDIHGGH